MEATRDDPPAYDSKVIGLFSISLMVEGTREIEKILAIFYPGIIREEERREGSQWNRRYASQCSPFLIFADGEWDIL